MYIFKLLLLYLTPIFANQKCFVKLSGRFVDHMTELPCKNIVSRPRKEILSKICICINVNKYYLYIYLLYIYIYKWVNFVHDVLDVHDILGILGIIRKNNILDIIEKNSILDGALVERDIKAVGNIVNVAVVISAGV